MKKELVEQLSNTLSVPPETIGSVPLIRMHGSFAIIIENHRGIIAYDPKAVCVKTKTGMIRISGDRLCIFAMTKKTLELRGCIHKVELA